MDDKKRITSSEEKELESFTDSFASFNKITEKLHFAYKELEEKFEDLNRKLEDANQELRESLLEKHRLSNYLNNILESINSGVLAIDSENRITLFNRAAEEIVGLKAEEVFGKNYDQIWGDVPQDLTPFYTLKNKEPISNQEKEMENKKGKKIPLGFSTSLLTNGEGEVLGAVEVFFDLSQLKKLEEEVMRVKTLAALGEMAATVAHEVRNPLGGIAGFAALLERDLEDTDPRKKLVRKIIEGVENLNRIVSNLLTYTRQIKLNLLETDFQKFLDEILNFFEFDLKRNNRKVKLIKDYGFQEAKCRFDPEQIRQVILNLLQNASQSIIDSGEIKTKVFSNRALSQADWDIIEVSDEERLILQISDNGKGMNKTTLEKLFTPFFTTKEHGTGLGLSIAKKIVQSHKGKIEVESEEGKGTTVRISIPMNL
jgi:PAS domain S-box-containing protein